jgi:hypothetical protein
MEAIPNPVLWSLAILVMSSVTLLAKYRKGQLLTASGGAHFQLLVFYGFGGLALALLPSAEPRLSEAEVNYFGDLSLKILLAGYALSFVAQRVFQKLLDVRQAANDLMPTIGSAATFALGAVALSSIATGFLFPSALGNVGVYLGSLFYPALFLVIVNFGLYSFPAKVASVLFFVVVLALGFYSPWRSFLVVTIVTIGIGIAVRYKYLIPWAIAALATALVIVFPFQVLKRRDTLQFQADPFGMFARTLTLSIDQRTELLGQFFVIRISYSRELIYVARALEYGLIEPQDGDTYAAIVYQIVPRFIWPDKPELANWAGFELPRLVGLLDRTDYNTSWAVNPFAEACYNFELYSLIWFVPLFFLIMRLLENIVAKSFRNPRSARLANISQFFIVLSMTTVIFGVTLIISILLIAKAADHMWDVRPDRRGYA